MIEVSLLNKNQKRRHKIASRDNFYCFYCGRSLAHASASAAAFKRHSPDMVTIDHKNPRRKNGSDDESNLVCACVSCNSQKHNRTLEEYRFYLTWEKDGTWNFLLRLLCPTSTGQAVEMGHALIREVLNHHPISRFYGEIDFDENRLREQYKKQFLTVAESWIQALAASVEESTKGRA